MLNNANIVLVTNTRMNTTITSQAVPLVDIYGFAVQAVVTGTPTGSIKLQASVDPFKHSINAEPQAPTNWVDVENSTFNLTASGITQWNFNGAFFTFVRLVYTDTSGGSSTAVLNANINVKGP